MNRASLCFAAAMLVALAIAAALRIPRLDFRPMHADEANQAVKAGRLYESGTYEYDATDHHGPSLYWLTQPALYLSGAKDLAGSSEVVYRIVPVFFGLGLIGLYLLFVDGLGRIAVAVAALLTAISPAMVFYSRYYIQEMLLVFFTVAAIGCSWRYMRSGRIGWILAAGASLGMMHATKETWILSAAAAAVSFGIVWSVRRPGVRPVSVLFARAPLHILAAVLVAGLVAVALFSMFGKNWHGPLDSLTAYVNYFRRGSQGGEHKEPWYYYLQILFAYRPSKHVFWSEGLIAALTVVGLESLLVHAIVLGGPGGLFSMQGRYNRARFFWTAFLIPTVVNVLAAGLGFTVGASAGDPAAAQLAVLPLIILGTVVVAFQVVKRLHDLDRPGAHYWLLLIPLYNIYLGLVLLFARGTSGLNRFGANSLHFVAKHREKASPLVLFLAFYTLILLVFYSALSYKTPWCVLSFHVGFVLLAGVGAEAILRAVPTWPLKSLAAAALAAGGVQLGWQAYQLNFNPRYVADPCNPFVYAHTPMPLPRLGKRLDRFRECLHDRDLTIHVVVKENYWPLPWYLRKFSPDSTYYWLDPDQWQKDLERFPLPDVLILSADVDSPELAARLSGYNGQDMESLRPGVLVSVYVRNELWPEFIGAK